MHSGTKNDFISATGEIIQTCIDTVSARYDGKLRYHDRSHTERTVACARILAVKLLEHDRISLDDSILVPLAMAGHDIVHDTDDAELKSAKETLGHMAAHEYMFKPEQMGLVEAGILATITTLDPATMKLKQNASPDNIFECIIADSDLSMFCGSTDMYIDGITRYYEETYNHPIADAANGELTTFYTDQLAIIQNHTYYLAETETLHQNRQNNIEALKAKLQGLARI